MLVDELADLEIDEDLVHVGSDDDGGSEEETAVQAAPPAPAPAAAANRGRGTSAKGAGTPGKGQGGKTRPAAAVAGQNAEVWLSQIEILKPKHTPNAR